MTITNEPIIAGQAVTFIVKGYPEEESVKASVERFYRLKPDAEKTFLVNNAFNELIMSGSADQEGMIALFQHHDRKVSDKH